MRFFSLLFAVALAGCGNVQIATPQDMAIEQLPDFSLPFDLAQPPPPRDLESGPDLAPYNGPPAIFFDVTDDVSGEGLPSRVLIKAVPPTPPIQFDLNSMGMPSESGTSPAPGIVGSPEGIMLVSGSGLLPIPEGTYDIFVTHGPEWEADVRRVTVGQGPPIVVAAALRHSVDTQGWLAADLHIHTARSFDSRVQTDVRVVSEVTAGIPLIVTTDHNVISDLQPDVDALGYHHIARAIIGDEFNFFEGHGGAYPVPYDPKDQFGGTVAQKLDWDTVKNIHSAQMFDFMHALPTRPAVTVNHPRLLPDLGYFTNLGWSPPMPMPDAGRFDGMEVLNGYMQTPMDLADLLRDWFFLLNTGTRVTALGSSDTHRLRDVLAGFPRSWLMLPTSKPAFVMPNDIADAIKAGRAIASNGPFVLLRSDGHAIGEIYKNWSGTALVDVLVDAPAWMDVDRMRVFVNGKVVAERMITPGRRPLVDERITVKLPSGDAWIAVQAGGSKPLPLELIGDHAGGLVVPFAISNPVYIDGDGDGAFKPAFAQLVDADPGPISPLTIDRRPPQVRPSDLDSRLGPMLGGRHFGGGDHPAPEDCEPPLWADPSTWVNPY